MKSRRDQANARHRDRYRDDPQYAEQKRAASRKHHRANAAAISAQKKAARMADNEGITARERARRAADPIKARARDARYMARYPEKVRAKNRRRHLRDYGLTNELFEAMVSSQQERCAICRLKFPKDRRAHVDHNHETLKVRGLLCQHCNLLIGHAREDVRILELAIKYLERHRE